MESILHEHGIQCYTVPTIKQEAQLLQRGYATLRVIKNVAKLLEVIRNYTTEYGMCMFLLAFHCNYNSCIVSEIFYIKQWHAVVIWVKGNARSFERHHSINHVRFRIHVP